MAIASNESFSGWTRTFTDARLCAAIFDRLTFGGNIIETGQNSREKSPWWARGPPPPRSPTPSRHVTAVRDGLTACMRLLDQHCDHGGGAMQSISSEEAAAVAAP